MLKKVKLYGELADFVGHKELDAVVNSTADAIRFLVSNFPKLEAHMANRHYKVIVDDYDIDETQLHDPIGQSDINIVPIISGAGGNLGKILLGAALIGGAFAFGGLTFAGGLGKSLAGASGFTKAAFGIGSALVIGGVSDMLFPVDTSIDEEDPRRSVNFSGIQNTTRAGTTHPIVYGEIITGSVVISAGIDTDQVTA